MKPFWPFEIEKAIKTGEVLYKTSDAKMHRPLDILKSIFEKIRKTVNSNTGIDKEKFYVLTVP